MVGTRVKLALGVATTIAALSSLGAGTHAGSKAVGSAALKTLNSYCGDYPEDMAKVGTRLEADGWTLTDPPIRDFDASWYKSPGAGTQLVRLEDFKPSAATATQYPTIKLFNCEVVEYDGNLDVLAAELSKQFKTELEKTTLDEKYHVPNYMVRHAFLQEPQRRLHSADYTAAPFLVKGKTVGAKVKVTYVINTKFDR